MPKQTSKRLPAAEAESESGDEISQQTTTAAQKRKHQEDEGESRKRTKHEFSYLKAKTRRIPQELITSQWKRLPDLAQKQVREIFVASKRTALNTIRDSKRRDVAEKVLNSMVKRLEKQLPRMPFPSASKASHFNLEDALERNRCLEAEQIPAMDSVKLLKEEIEREELRIEKKRQTLADLETNTKAASQKYKKRAKATHPLLQDVPNITRYHDDADSIGLSKSLEGRRVFDELDEDLVPLLSQFRSHLESIQANGNQLEGVGDAIASAQAVLTVGLPQPGSLGN